MSGSTTPSDSVALTISPDPSFDLSFTGMTVAEELGRPFDCRLNVTSSTRSGDITKLLGATATVTMKQADGSKRYFNGVIMRAVYTGMSGGAFRYELEVRPWISLLSRARDYQIFQNKSAWDIITGLFRTAGFTDFQDKRQSQSGDIVLEYCVQYEETSLDFVTRLMERYGIYYFATHQEGRHTLVFADDPSSHSSIGAAIPFSYQANDLRQVDNHIWEWASDLQLQPGKVTLRDYNFTTPSADLTTKSNQPATTPHGDMEVYDYPGNYQNTGDGQKLATVRMQHLTAQCEIVRCSSNARGIVVGGKFTLSNNPDATQNREYLIVSTTTSFVIAEGRAGAPDQYAVSLTAIPGTTQYRMAELTPWPRMRGPQTAKVVGASGDEITTDQYARIKLKFFWDRSPGADENSSCWIRVSQSWAGPSFGGIVIPRIGQEVIVDFLDGNPDRPIVTGCVYNATNMVADALPANKTRSGFKTNSSSGGGGFNELRFEDKKGSEEVLFQAQKDYNVTVLNNQTATITQDRTTTVQKGNDGLTVSQGNRSVTVSQGNNSATISQGNDSLTISTGDHSITISAGSSTISAGKSITLKVGANSLAIDTSGITINGAKIGLSATGQLSASAGGTMALSAPSIALN